MLETETYTLDEAIDELETAIGDIDDDLEGLDAGSDRASALRNRRNRLAYFRDGIVWQRDEVGWGGGSEIEIGGLTAGEKALMHREAPDKAGREEMRLWWVAAATASAPYAGDDLSETFAGLSATHPAFTEFLEGKINGLSTPGREAEGNGSSTSSPETPATETSTDESESSTSS